MIGENQLQGTTDAAWESQGVSANEGERGGPQPPGGIIGGGMLERSPEEGVPQARRPRLRQVGCETCCLRLEQYQRLLQCHGCRNWIHEECVEQLDIGTSWHADMCLTCKFEATRMLRVVSACSKCGASGGMVLHQRHHPGHRRRHVWPNYQFASGTG